MSGQREERHASGAGARSLFQRPGSLDSSRTVDRTPLVRRRGSGATPHADGPPDRYIGLKSDLQARLLDEMQRRDLLGAEEEELTAAADEFVQKLLEREELPINERERAGLVAELVEEALGVGPLAPLMADPAVTDVLVNGWDQVFVERYGRLEHTDVRFRDDAHVRRLIERLAMRVGRRVDQAWPMVDMRLPDGSRVNATLPPASVDGPTLSIRRFGRNRLRADDLLRAGMFSTDMLRFLQAAVRHRQNILISGGTGAGKSTLLGALAESISLEERILTIEDTAELDLDQPHVVRLEARPPNVEGSGRILVRDLLVNSLRMRPSRIVIGEVRSAEALDMLQAMNTGHDGGLCTIHANTARDALSRLESMVLMAGIELPSRTIREQMSAALDFIVHVARFEDGSRRVTSITEVCGMEGTVPLLQEIFSYTRQGLAGQRVVGEFRATGIVPRVVEDLRRRGAEIPTELFTGPGALP